MASSPATEQPDAPRRGKADDALPRVEPPGAGFILQLFLIPLLIVVIIVSVWLAFSWLAHLGSDPHELVDDIARGDKYGWQKAATLADLLRNREYDHLKTDAKLAGKLAAALGTKIDEGDDGYSDDALIERQRLRIFLCRALGEFRTEVVVPVLLKAAETQRKEEEVAVRRAAVQALAILAGNLGPEKLRRRADVLQVLRRASQERPSSGDDADNAYAELRSNAAFALGMLGGPEALDRLELVLGDSYANARYNAATGLARHGDVRANSVLAEMLDPLNEAAVSSEESPAEKDWKRSLIHVNAMKAIDLLREANPEADLSELVPALETLAAAPRAQSTVKQRAAALAKTLKK
jgi:hypothetical protein